MPAVQAFQVVSDFRFEVGSALLGTRALQGQVDKLSDSADDALFSFKRLGFGLAASFGLGTSGFLGLLSQAVRTSEKFKITQLSFSNLISSNLEFLSGSVDTFNDRLRVSEQILINISKQSRKFGLPEQQLVDFTKLVSAQLIPKGLAGANFQTATNISRNLLKAAPTLGVTPSLVQGQLLRIIEGQATRGDTLFRRLLGETQAFAPFREGGRGGVKRFNALEAAKRVDVLDRALRQFASDMDVLKGITETTGRQLQIMQDIFLGITGILRPLGDVISAPLVDILKKVNKILNTEGRQIFNNISLIIGPLIDDFKSVAVTLLQLRNAARDLQATQKTLGIIGIGIIITQIFGFIRILKFLGISVGFLLTPLALLSRVLPFIGTALLFIGRAALVIAKPLALIFFIFQLFSRAAAFAKIKDLERLPGIIAEFTKIMSKARAVLGVILGPFIKAFDSIAQSLSFLFQKTILLQAGLFILDKLVGGLEFLATGFTLVQAALVGITAAVMQFLENIRDFGIKSLFTGEAFENVPEIFDTAIEDIIKRNLDAIRAGKGEAAVTNQVTNIGKVQITNAFKENLEPDRIAFTLKEQLLKTARNPTQARKRSLNTTQLAPAGGF